MRVQCPKCDASVEVTRFTTEGSPPRLRYACPACGETVTETSHGPDPTQPGPGEPEASERPDAPATAPDAAVRVGADVLWRAWDQVAEAFDDEARHDAFLAACEASGDLPFAAARYREWAESHPEDEISPKRLQQISALAQVKAFLAVSRGKPDKDPLRKAVVLGLVLLVFVIVAALTAPLIFRGIQDQQSDGRRAPKPPQLRPLENLSPRRRAAPMPLIRPPAPTPPGRQPPARP